MRKTSGRKSFEIASANLIGPCLRTMQRMNAKNRIECIIDNFERYDNETFDQYSEISKKENANLAEVKQISSAYKCIIECAAPDHLINFEGNSKADVKSLLEILQCLLPVKLNSQSSLSKVLLEKRIHDPFCVVGLIQK